MASIGFNDSDLLDLQRRLVILRVGLLLVVALLALRLWHLQIREGPYYRDLSELPLSSLWNSFLFEYIDY